MINYIVALLCVCCMTSYAENIDLKQNFSDYLKKEELYSKKYETMNPPDSSFIEKTFQNKFDIIRDVLKNNKLYRKIFIEDTVIFPRTIKADKIYCELLKEYILSKEGINRKKAFYYNIEHCAGSKYTVKLINDILPVVEEIEGEINREDYYKEYMKKVLKYSKIYDDLKNINKKLSLVPFYYKDSEYPEKTDDTDEEELEKSGVDDLLSPVEDLLRSIKIEKEKNIKIPISDFLGYIAEQGGRIEDDFSDIINYSRNKYAVIDSESQNIIYLFIFNNVLMRKKDVYSFYLIEIKYDNDGGPKYYVPLKIYPYSKNIRDFIIKIIYPLSKRKNKNTEDKK